MITVCPTVDDIANILDAVHQGIDKSDFGPMYFQGPSGDLLDKKVNQLAFAILPQVIKEVFAKVNFSGKE